MTSPAPAPSPPLVPAVFLERDGVLIDDVGHPWLDEHLRLTPGAAAAVRRLNRLGYLIVVVSHQSGVARGLMTEVQAQAFNALLVRRLAKDGAIVGAVHACSHHPEAQDERWRHPDHPDRMPNPGLLLRAIADHHIDPARSFLIGARPRSQEAARRAGVSGFRFDGGDLDAFVRDLMGE